MKKNASRQYICRVVILCLVVVSGASALSAAKQDATNQWFQGIKVGDSFPGALIQPGVGEFESRLVVQNVNGKRFSGRIYLDRLKQIGRSINYQAAFGVVGSLNKNGFADIQITAIPKQPRLRAYRLPQDNVGMVLRGKVKNGQFQGNISDRRGVAGRNSFRFKIPKPKVLMDGAMRQRLVKRLKTAVEPVTLENGLAGMWLVDSLQCNNKPLDFDPGTTYEFGGGEIIVESPSGLVGQLLYFQLENNAEGVMKLLGRVNDTWQLSQAAYQVLDDELVVSFTSPENPDAQLVPLSSDNGKTLIKMSRHVQKKNDAVPIPTEDLFQRAISLYGSSDFAADQYEVRKIFVRLARKRHFLSQMWIARCLDSGRCGFEEDKPLAQALATTLIPRVKKLASTGNPDAIFLLASACEDNLGLSKDTVKSLELYQEAAALGHALAMNNLALNIREKGDLKEARRWFKKAAEAGSLTSTFSIGAMHEFGEGGPTNVDAAMKYYLSAAANGHKTAMFNAGGVYDGRRDYVNALPWYWKAIVAGDMDGYHNLGVYFANGRGIAKDVAAARFWLEEGSKNGVDNARKALRELNRPARQNWRPPTRAEIEYQHQRKMRQFQQKLQRGF